VREVDHELEAVHLDVVDRVRVSRRNDTLVRVNIGSLCWGLPTTPIPGSKISAARDHVDVAVRDRSKRPGPIAVITKTRSKASTPPAITPAHSSWSGLQLSSAVSAGSHRLRIRRCRISAFCREKPR
jgi:hypothetical protein